MQVIFPKFRLINEAFYTIIENMDIVLFQTTLTPVNTNMKVPLFLTTLSHLE